jgi:ferritin-like metal-binding protein YciE
VKAAFEKHEAEKHVARLKKVFEEIDETPRGKTCDAILGKPGSDEKVQGRAPALDAGLLAAAQAVEHYRDCPLRDTQDLGRQSSD